MNIARHILALHFFAVAALSVAAPGVLAKTLPPESARILVERGDILPLAKVLGRLQLAADGEIIAIILDDEGGHYMYRIKVLGNDGQCIEYQVDAKTGVTAGISGGK